METVNATLLNQNPQSRDVEYVHHDLIYCIHQAFSLTLWCSGQDVSDMDSVLHDALLETSLLNIRNLDYFITRRGSGADISLRHLRRLGFTSAVPPILTPEESRLISQLFAHITANRNVDRMNKKGFPLTRYLRSVVDSFDPILSFFESRFESIDHWESDNIREARQHFQQMLRKQESLDRSVQQRGLCFYVSGSWRRVR